MKASGTIDGHPFNTTLMRSGTRPDDQDHTQAESMHTQPSRVSAGRVCEPQVGQAIGAPSLSSWVASAESSGDARRLRCAGVRLLSVIVSSQGRTARGCTVHL